MAMAHYFIEGGKLCGCYVSPLGDNRHAVIPGTRWEQQDLPTEEARELAKTAIVRVQGDRVVEGFSLRLEVTQ